MGLSVGHRESLIFSPSVGLVVRNREGIREVLIVSISVRLIVGRIVCLNAGLSVSIIGGLDVFLNIGPGVGLSVIISLVRDMVVIDVVRGAEIPP